MPAGYAAAGASDGHRDGSSANPQRIIAGRTFTIEYGTAPGVIVLDTLAGAPGTTFAGGADGSTASPTVPAPGPAPFTVRYYGAAAPPGQECTQSLTFTVPVERGDLVSAPLGYAQGTTVRFIGGFKRLPRQGVLLSGGGPITGILFPCTPTTAGVPVVAELRVERALRRKPSPTSPSRR